MTWLGWCLVAVGLVVWSLGACGFADEVREFLADLRQGQH